MRYSISQVERIFGISQSTIRRYEEAGMVCARRTPGSRYRYYSTGDIARLSVYVGMRQQHYLPQELGKLACREDKLRHVYTRIEEIDDEIERLNAEKTCWLRHIALFKLMEELKANADSGRLCRYETLIGSWFDDEQTTYDTLFFQMLRESSIYRNYFRLCCFFPQHAADAGLPPYRQAYCAPLELLKKEDILRIKNRVYMPEREYIVAYSSSTSIIDEEVPDKAKQTVERVQKQVASLLERFERAQCSDAMTMTVNVTPDMDEAILFIPVCEKESAGVDASMP